MYLSSAALPCYSLDIGQHVLRIRSENDEDEDGDESVGGRCVCAVGMPYESCRQLRRVVDAPKMTLQQLRMQIILSLGAL